MNNKKIKKVINKEINAIKEENISINNKLKNIYFGYRERLLSCIILLFLFLVLGIVTTINIIETVKVEQISYQEQGNIDYNVEVYPNAFYDKTILDKNMSYVASLIKNINLDIKYNFNADKELSGTNEYNVIATINILNKDTKELFYTKDYILLDDVIEKFKSKGYNINEKIQINYGYYNNLANQFKMLYGVDCESNLEVSVNLKRNIEDKKYDNANLNSADNIILNIPLSQNAITIKMDAKNINNIETQTLNKIITTKTKIYIVAAIIFDLLAIILFIRTFKLLSLTLPKQSKYDSYISKIRKHYDRIIIDVEKEIDYSEYHITYIKEFNELLDLRDNLQLPIRYIEITPHSKCNFYIINKNELFIYIVKAVDLENKK